MRRVSSLAFVQTTFLPLCHNGDNSFELQGKCMKK